MMKTHLALLSLLLLVAGHPGEHHTEEDGRLLLSRRQHRAAAARGLDACKSKRAFQQLQARSVQRRAAAARAGRKLKRTDAAGVGHNLTDSRPDVDADADGDTVFGSNHTCILNPEGEIGPYYVKGELIREDLREDQAGVPVILEGQFIDVETCEPIADLYWDVWNCNSTGVYSGVSAQGNGNSNDESIVDETFLRGLAKTDSDGVVQFKTLFPGHYTGRTTHYHMVAWLNASVNDNKTLTSSHAAHIGQLFWDQDLIDLVEATEPYSSNTQTLTQNAKDRVLAGELENTDSDPFLSYVYLGNSLSDGLFGWTTIGINTSASYQTSYSFEYTSSGGVAVEGGGGGGSSSGGPGSMNGSAPGSMNGSFPGGPNGTAAASGGSSSSSANTASSATASSGASFPKTIALWGASTPVSTLLLAILVFVAIHRVV